MAGCRHGDHIARAGCWKRQPKNGVPIWLKAKTLRLQRGEQSFWRTGGISPLGLIDQDLAPGEFAQPIYMVNMKMGHDGSLLELAKNRTGVSLG